MYLGVRLLQGVRFQTVPGLQKPILTIQQSAMIEVKALHTRILVEIFLERNPRVDDINIDDLIPTWREEYPTIAHNLKTAYKSKLKAGNIHQSPKWFLNKFLVHADKRRGDSFDWSPIIGRMNPYLRAVFQTLPVDKLPTLEMLTFVD